MNIIDFIKGLFKSKTIDTYNIININDIVQIPKRDKLSKEQVILLDKYKQEYSKILSNKKVFSSKDLTIGSFNEEMSMNINLLLNICINDKENNSFGVQRKENNIDLMIKILKLKLCQNSLSNMETEIITRIIALKEIYKEKKYLFSPNKRNSIASEINNLTNTIVIYLNQKNAIQIEVDAYLDSIETLSSSNTISKGDEDKYLIDRKNELLEMISIVMNNIPSIIEGNIKLEIAQLERILEIYVYNHKEDIKKIDRELELLSKENKSVRNRDQLLEQITKLEFKYRIFDEFGRHIVTENQINNLYRVKFDILTIDINNRRESPINEKTNSKELEVYKQIVMEKIEKIVTGNNSRVQTTFKEDVSKARLMIIKILKDGNRKFDIDRMLTDTLLLSLLLSFDVGYGFNQFFREYKIKKSSFNFVNFHEDICTWEEDLPLATIDELLLLNEEKMPLLYQLYNLMKKYNYAFKIDGKRYSLPIGLKEVDIPSFFNKDEHIIFLNNMQKKATNKFINLPSSIRKISGNLFGDGCISGIKLNEGLEYIGSEVLENQELKSINIPSTLRVFPKIKEVEVIEFDDFENLKTINSFKDYLNFFNFCFKKIKKNYVCNGVGYEIIMRVPVIIFENKNSYKELKRDNFKVTFNGEWGNPDKNYISFKECQIIHQELEKVCNIEIKHSLGKVLYDF